MSLERDIIRLRINSDVDEDFDIEEKNNKITIFLNGTYFTNSAKIIVENNKMLYIDKDGEREKNINKLEEVIFAVDNWVTAFNNYGSQNFDL